jgi:hypothetical protein
MEKTMVKFLRNFIVGFIEDIVFIQVVKNLQNDGDNI